MLVKYKHVKNNNTLNFIPLFTSLKKKRKKAVERIYTTSKDEKIIISMFEELGPDDQDLLFAILSIALPVERGATLDPKSTSNQEIISKLDQLQKCNKREYIQIETTIYELLKEMGKTCNKQSYNVVIKSLKRLSRTTVELETSKYLGVINLLYFCLDKTTKKIKITLNPLSSLTILGLDNYVYIDRQKYTKLSKIARILYPFIRGLPRPKTISILTILKRVYGVEEIEMTATTATTRKRIERISRALDEIARVDQNLVIQKIGRGKNISIQIKQKM